MATYYVHLIGPIDHWGGCLAPTDHDYLLMAAVQESSGSADSHKVTAGPYSFVTPVPEMCEMVKCTIFKQHNNGICYVIAKETMPWLEKDNPIAELNFTFDLEE